MMEKAHFVRNQKTTLGNIIKYPFYDCGRTTAVEAINFFLNKRCLKRKRKNPA